MDLLFNDQAGQRPFIFPVELCFSEQFKFDLLENIKQVKAENPEANPHNRWELIKTTIRSTALSFKRTQSKIRKEMVESLELKIAKQTILLDQENSHLLKAGHNEKIKQLNKELDNLFQEGKLSAMLGI